MPMAQLTTMQISALSGANTYPSIINSDYLKNLCQVNKGCSDYVKRYEVIETTEDLLALSTTWKRLRDKKVSKSPVDITSLLDDNLFRQVTEPDRVQANIIRDYFSKKIVIWTLKDVKLSKYRKDLSAFIHGTNNKVTEELLPLIYRLPEFYEYDIVVDSFKQDITLDIPGFNEMQPTNTKVILTPIKCVYKRNTKVNQFEYWMKNSYGNAFLIVVEPYNPLKHIWDTMFKQEHLYIDALLYPKKLDDIQYFKLLSWKIVS